MFDKERENVRCVGNMIITRSYERVKVKETERDN